MPGRERRPKWRTLPLPIMKAAEEAGGKLQKCPGEKLYSLTVSFNDAAFNVIHEWVSTLDCSDPSIIDPPIFAMYSPSENAQISGLCREEIFYELQCEANSIAFHYAQMTADDFIGESHLSIPIPGPCHTELPFGLGCAKITLFGLLSRIQNMDDTNYPFISGLEAGTYISTLTVIWSGAQVMIDMYKA